MILYVLDTSVRKNIKYSHDISDKTRDEKLKHNINREAVKISALPSEKVDKYDYLTDKAI